MLLYNNFKWAQMSKRMHKCSSVCVCVATTRGHMEKRKQEMPDVHQPDLSEAGEQECRLGVPPLPSHDPPAVNGTSGAKSKAEFDFSKEK